MLDTICRILWGFFLENVCETLERKKIIILDTLIMLSYSTAETLCSGHVHAHVIIDLDGANNVQQCQQENICVIAIGFASYRKMNAAQIISRHLPNEGSSWF